MKKKDLEVGGIYAHKNDDRPHMLMAMQLWHEDRESYGYGGGLKGYQPARQGEVMRSYSYLGSGAVGRVCLVAETRDELWNIRIPEFLEQEYHTAHNEDYGRQMKSWLKTLPEGVRMELVNTAQLEGPYTSVVEQRRKDAFAREARIKKAERIRDEWQERQNLLQDRLRKLGLGVAGIQHEYAIPGADIYIMRPDRVEMSIEDMERLLSLLPGSEDMNTDGEYEIGGRVFLRENGPTDTGTITDIEPDGTIWVRLDADDAIDGFESNDLRPVRNKS